MTFRYRSEQPFERAAGAGILMEVVTGRLVFRLERDAELNLKFFYGSPGTGTRVATVSLDPLAESLGIIVYMCWSPEELGLSVGDEERTIGLQQAKGVASDRQLLVTNGGEVVSIGDAGLEVVGARIREGESMVLMPPAREAWQNTVLAMQTLLTGSSASGYMFEVVQANSVIVMLVTGFESYCETRFNELEGEGVPADFSGLLKKFPRIVERRGGEAKVRADAKEAGISPSLLLANQLNFQNYEEVKDAYRHAYGIRFSEDLGVGSDDLRDLKRALRHRHRIIHVSPLSNQLNESQVPLEGPIFIKRELADSLIALFDRFVVSLHAASLKLRPQA